MRAAVLKQMGQPLVIETIDDPVPGAGELLLEVEACGICGSDLHLSEAWPLGDLVMGHEFCGVVRGVGTGVEGWVEGQRAVGLPLVGCGRCAACVSGYTRKCVTASMIGIERGGAYAEFVTVGALEAVPIPDDFNASIGALIEPLAVGLHAVERARISPGDTVVVLGAGPVGQAVILWLHQLGAGDVIVSDPALGRRQLAERVGATASVDPLQTDLATAVTDLTGGLSPVVIECVGNPGMLGQAVDVSAVDGTVVIAGVCMPPDQFSPLTAMMKELELRFAYYYRNRDFVTTIDLIRAGRLDPTSLLTSETSLDDLPLVFEQLKSPSDECKVLIRP